MENKAQDKTQDRIEKAKKAYGLAENATDSFLTRLVSSRYTLAIFVVVVLCAVGAWWQWG